MIFILLIFLASVGAAQTQPDKLAAERLSKIEEIMRLQDLRTIHDGKLLGFLGDLNPVVRRRATLAFGTLQDTSVLSRLQANLQFGDSATQSAAAWAIGQTALMLSAAGRREAQNDFIWKRLGWTHADDVLVEELGKFGDATGLNDLIAKYGNTYPRAHPKAMVMSIARFGIRGITSPEAIRYLITLHDSPEDDLRWRAMYALMRIGDQPEVRREAVRLAKLYMDPNPLVRMHLATLLGKFKDAVVAREPLSKLAEFDADWRVRVNALRAFGNFDLNAEKDFVDLISRQFHHENEYVSITALSVLGGSNLKTDRSTNAGMRLWDALVRIVESREGGFPRGVQAEAAVSLAKLFGSEAFPTIRREGLASPYLQAKFLEAAAATRSVEAYPYLREFLDADDALVSRQALDGAANIARHNPTDSVVLHGVRTAALNALRSRDVALTATAADILADSLFRDAEATTALITTLESLRIPNDIEAMRTLIAALGELRNSRAVQVLKKQLDQPDRTVSAAAANALTQITGADYSRMVPKYSKPLFTDYDFEFLRSLPDTVEIRIETIRGDIEAELYKDAAPFTVLNLLKLARRGYYKGLVFHRVVPNFVIQGGDPRGDGWGGPGYTIRSEFSSLTYDEGSLGIASGGKDTEGSQFFITQSPQPHLDGRYTLFGRVKRGMAMVNRIQIEDRIFDVKMISVRR